MIRNKVSIERQFDLKLYQFLIPHEGTWEEALAFAKDIQIHCEKVLKEREEEEKSKEKSE